MQQGRYGHTATVLTDGTVLILGGIGDSGQVLSGAEIFDLTTSTFAAFPVAGITARAFHTATLLTDGRVVVAGGVSS